MRKLFVLLCLSTSLAHAMNNPNQNALSVDINDPSLSQILGTLSRTSKTGIIIVGGQNDSTANNPEDDFLSILREIAETKRAAAAIKAQEQRKALLLQCATIAAGAFAVFALLNNING